ncbi:hypothetical protein NQ314_001867 [Rhamnusium bicolor]|uniref:Uncharacterized protein n=1 Tax=Rhamnusium bicolor TaxID=1586634 RepID=A0AAV8ZTQ6_9CUCU|nr:hypothetical protein NQ314_001867 [Rhamnusium bicolor]
MNLPILKLKQDVSTRWNSCLIMLERLLKIKDALCVVVSQLPKVPDFLNADEWIILHDCVKILKPAEDMTKILSAEKYPTISLVIPLYRGFQSALRNVRADTEVGKILKTKLLDA